MTPLVAVVDDDISVRDSLESLLRSAGMAVRVFISAEELLDPGHPCRADCLILDVRLKGISGIGLHRHLLTGSRKVPAIFITAHGSEDRARAEAVSDWTVAYLKKPFSGDELLHAVHAALNFRQSVA